MKRILDFLRDLFASCTDEELVGMGIVPASRRYDRLLVERMMDEAMATRAAR